MRSSSVCMGEEQKVMRREEEPKKRVDRREGEEEGWRVKEDKKKTDTKRK